MAKTIKSELEETPRTFDNVTITFPEFTVNHNTYSTFEVRYPSFSEVTAHYDIISDIASQAGYNALAALTKLCITNLKVKSDFGAFPAPVANKLMNIVGERIAWLEM